jgi:transcriptional regulator with XRE-family HTH domain
MYGEKLKKIRESHNLSQDEIALIGEVSQSAVSNYEKAAFPDLEYTAKICAYYKIPLWEFFDLNGEIEKKYNIPQELINLCDRIKALKTPTQEKFLYHVRTGLDLIAPVPEV